MLSIRIICIGKLKEKYWRDAAAEYVKRLAAYCSLEITELKEERLPSGASLKDEQMVICAESDAILSKLKDKEYVIAMDPVGREIDSTGLADKIRALSQQHSDIAFVIGGSLGLSDELKKHADEQMSLGKITLPHQLARVVTLEQIYRAFKINAGETYHK